MVNIFKSNIMKEKGLYLINISLKFTPQDPIDNRTSHHWLKLWCGAEIATSHYLNQWSPISLIRMSYQRALAEENLKHSQSKCPG